MAKKPNPWFGEARSLGCVTINTEREILSEHPAESLALRSAR